MFCNKCGAQLPDGVSFCSRCGAPRVQAQAPYQQPLYPPPGGFVPPPGEKGKATASMVLGIVAVVLCWAGWFCFVSLVMAIVAIILGIQAGKSCPPGYQGHGMAIAGLILGIIAVALASIAVLFWIKVAKAFAPFFEFFSKAFASR